MRILIRVGSAAKGIEDILRSIARDGLPTENILFCTDDKHIETIRQEGHINCNARLAVSCGIPPVEAVKMASYNAARAYGLKNIGAIAPGYKADMVLFEDLKDFRGGSGCSPASASLTKKRNTACRCCRRRCTAACRLRP